MKVYYKEKMYRAQCEELARKTRGKFKNVDY